MQGFHGQSPCHLSSLRHRQFSRSSQLKISARPTMPFPNACPVKGAQSRADSSPRRRSHVEQGKWGIFSPSKPTDLLEICIITGVLAHAGQFLQPNQGGIARRAPELPMSSCGADNFANLAACWLPLAGPEVQTAVRLRPFLPNELSKAEVAGVVNSKRRLACFVLCFA